MDIIGINKKIMNFSNTEQKDNLANINCDRIII
mgnify:FL=1